MRHFSLILGALVLFAALAGCSQDELMRKLTSDAEQKRALELIETMRRSELAALEPKFDRSLVSPDFAARMEYMSKIAPAGEPSERKLVGVQTNVSSGTRTVNLTYQYRFGERFFLLNCATAEKDAAFTIIGMSVKELEKSVEEQQKFSFAGKSAAHYAVFLLACFFALLSVYALVRCIVDRAVRRKWLWILVIIFGVMEFSLEWSSGAWSFQPLTLLLFSVSLSTSDYGSWVLSLGLPAGAVVYLLRRRRNHPAAALSNET